MVKDFIFYDFIFHKENLEKYIQMFSDDKWNIVVENTDTLKRHSIFLSDRPGHNVYQKRYYPSPTILIENYINFLSDLSAVSIEQYFKNGYTIDSKVVRYFSGGKFDWHSDTNVTVPESTKTTRILSSITYLNDDYTGGETEFENFIVKPEKGKTLIFPSNWCFMHRGREVVDGCKYILVMHVWV